jgi:hypothetical protein
MDRYDAILEQLKKAQSQGVDSVTSRLEAVVASLDELLRTAKSTVQSAISSETEEKIPFADVKALVARMRTEGLGGEGTTSPSGITLENLRTLDAARSQSELLRALLPMLSEHIGRGAVMVIRDQTISAWSGVGFGDDEELKRWHGQVTGSPNIKRLLESPTPVSFSPTADPLISGWLAGSSPDEAVLLPISLRGKLMGAVYIDHAGNQPWNPDAAQALNAVACWLIDTLQFRTVVPTPTLAEIEAGAARTEGETRQETIEPSAGVASQEPVASTEFEPSPEPTAAEQPPQPSAVETPVAEQEIEYQASAAADGAQIEEPQPQKEVVEIDYDFEPEPASFESETPDTGFDPSATVRVDAREDLGAHEAPSTVGDFTPPAAEAARGPSQPPPVEEIPTPPPVKPIEPPADMAKPAPAERVDSSRSPEEEAQQEEARRFARLLVSEIKLYNEDEVERGRAAKDIGVRLKDDIERSREMFEKRISEDVRTGHDYFRDELVRILADGDADAMGV